MFDLATLDQYDWVQNDRGDTDLTTLTFSMPIGERCPPQGDRLRHPAGRGGDRQPGLPGRHRDLVSAGPVRSPAQPAARLNPCDSRHPGERLHRQPVRVSGGTSTGGDRSRLPGPGRRPVGEDRRPAGLSPAGADPESRDPGRSRPGPGRQRRSRRHRGHHQRHHAGQHHIGGLHPRTRSPACSSTNRPPRFASGPATGRSIAT